VSEEHRTAPARPTIYDVAERANVSKSLVSLVMRGSSNVSEERRAAVLKAAAELGWRPNAHARAMVEGKTRTIGVLISDLRNPYFAEIVDGLEEELGSSRFRAVLSTGGRDHQREVRAIEALVERRIDGIVLLSPRIPVEEISKVAKTTPAVLVGRLTTEDYLDCVVNDDFAGALMAVEHLAELGHRRIAHITGGSGAGAEARRRGYESAMRELALGAYVQVAYGDYTDEGGYWGARRLLNAVTRPTAIFAANDFAAMGALTAISEAGLSVPEDISLVGYDNIYLAALSSISLSSVDQPRHDMGVLAGRLLLERIESVRSEARCEVLKPRLVARSSSTPPSPPLTKRANGR
jgi:DNA-binding LacI/PurR family transcriptional regulator